MYRNIDRAIIKIIDFTKNNTLNEGINCHRYFCS